MISAHARILQLRFDRITAVSHCPDVLREGPADLATDEASAGSLPQESYRGRPVENPYPVALRLVRTRLDGRRQSEISRPLLVLWVPRVGYSLS